MKALTYRQKRRVRAAQIAGAPKWSTLAREAGMSVGMAHMLFFGQRGHARRAALKYGRLMALVARDGVPPVRARRGMRLVKEAP